MLAELTEAHQRLLAAIAELEQLTREDSPDAGRLAQVRWNLSRASGQRRRLVDEACAMLLAGASAHQATALRGLQDDRAEILAASSKHIGTWTIDQVMSDWAGYRMASAMMRRAMRVRIESEKSILYPLLGLPTH